MRGHAKGIAGAVGVVLANMAEDPASTDIPLGSQIQPGGPVSLSFPGAQIGPDFRQDVGGLFIRTLAVSYID